MPRQNCRRSTFFRNLLVVMRRGILSLPAAPAVVTARVNALDPAPSVGASDEVIE
jgi:hypothetical protein